MLEIGMHVKIKEKQEIYVIKSIQQDIVTLKSTNERKIVSEKIQNIEQASEEEFEQSKLKHNLEVQEVKQNIKNEGKQRSSSKVLFGRILHLDGDKDFLEECGELYSLVGIAYQGVFMSEEDMPLNIEKILLDITPDIIIITGHDAFNNLDIKDINNYENSIHFVNTIRKIRKHFLTDNVIVIAGACGSHFESLIGAGANFASSPKRISTHTYDPAIVAIKCATTSFNKPVDFNKIVKHIENGKSAIGGIETNGKMKIIL